MNEITKAYVAGLMDGEGCFRLERFRTDRSLIGFQYRTIVEVTMCDKETIDFVAIATGKNIYQRRLPSGRTAYKIVWRNGIAAGLIRQILPYLRGKKEQAALCLHFEERITPGRGRSYKPDDLCRCENVRLELISLKQVETLRC